MGSAWLVAVEEIPINEPQTPTKRGWFFGLHKERMQIYNDNSLSGEARDGYWGDIESFIDL